MSAITGGFSVDIGATMPNVVKFLCRWHRHLKSKFAPTLTDHVLFRVVTGILVAAPEEINRWLLWIKTKPANLNPASLLKNQKRCENNKELMIVKMLKTGLILTLFNFYLGIFQTSPKSLRLSMK